MRWTWLKRISLALGTGMALGMVCRAAAGAPAESPDLPAGFDPTSAAAPLRREPAPIEPALLRVPPQSDQGVVPANWRFESPAASEAPIVESKGTASTAGAPLPKQRPINKFPATEGDSPIFAAQKLGQSPNDHSAGSEQPPTPAAESSERKSASWSLPPRGHLSRNLAASPGKLESPGSTKDRGDLGALISVAGSLGIVIGIFLLGVWVFRRAAPQGLTRLPHEVFEILGRAPLAGRQQVHLLRCGKKLLLVSVTPGGAETLTEITDPMEVDRLAGFCRQTHPQSSSAAFRQLFEQLASKRSHRGVGERQLYSDVDLSGLGVDGGGPSSV
jgi:flagellar protein FliO/FliZ